MPILRSAPARSRMADGVRFARHPLKVSRINDLTDQKIKLPDNLLDLLRVNELDQVMNKHFARWLRGLKITCGLVFSIGMAWFLAAILTLAAYGILVVLPLMFMHSAALEAAVSWSPVAALAGALVFGPYEVGEMQDDEISSMLGERGKQRNALPDEGQSK